jgi:hypothetical protein
MKVKKSELQLKEAEAPTAAEDDSMEDVMLEARPDIEAFQTAN